MKIKIIAAIAKNGVIGRTKKPCPACCTPDYARAVFHRMSGCSVCNESRVVPSNDLPWPPYKEDMEHFKRETMGHAIAMGRLTKESIPSKFFPLEGRTNIVVSKTEYCAPYDPGWRPLRFKSLPDALQDLRRFHKHHDTLYVIGGARLFAEALSIADELVLTLIDKEYEGDVRFPFGRGITPDMDVGSTHRLSNPAEPYDITFECIERRQGETPELTFTRWVRP